MKIKQSTTTRHPVDEGVTLSVENMNGLVEISTEHTDTITIEAEKSAWTEAALTMTDIAITQTDRHLLVVTVVPEEVKSEVNYRIKVPPWTNLGAISTINGRIVISNVGLGHTRVHIVNGDVAYTLGQQRARKAEDLHLETVNGNIMLEVPTESAFDYKLSTVNGNVRTDFDSAQQRSYNRVAGRNGPGGFRIRAVTINGGIAMRRKWT